MPTGRYDLEASLDLSPVYGKLDHVTTVDITVPSEAVLAERLEQLKSEDVNVRRGALIDLRYFRQDGDKVFPALLECLSDTESVIRMVALSVMMAYPKQATEHVDTFIAIVEGGPEVSVSERSNAIYILARYVPPSEMITEVLEKAWENADESFKPRMQSAIEQYRKRVQAAATTEE